MDIYAPIKSEIVKTITGQKLLPGLFVYRSNFSVNTDGWLPSQGAVAGNIDGIGGRDNCLRFTINSTSTAHQVYKSVLTVGQTYRIVGSIYMPSTNSHMDGVSVLDTSGGIQSGTALYYIQQNQWVDFEVSGVAASANFAVRGKDGTDNTIADPGGDDFFYLRDVLIAKL